MDNKLTISSDALKDHWDEKWKNRPWYQKFWEDYIQYSIYTVINAISIFPKKIKWFCQRGRRGYSDRDVWDLGTYVLRTLKAGVGSLRKNHNGYPTDLTNKKWESVLKQMEKGFDSGLELYEGMEEILDDKGKFKDYRSYTEKERKKYREQYDKAMDLLKEHLFSLWD